MKKIDKMLKIMEIVVFLEYAFIIASVGQYWADRERMYPAYGRVYAFAFLGCLILLFVCMNFAIELIRKAKRISWHLQLKAEEGQLERELFQLGASLSYREPAPEFQQTRTRLTDVRARLAKLEGKAESKAVPEPGTFKDTVGREVKTLLAEKE